MIAPYSLPAPAPRGLGGRLLGVLASPRSTYGEIVARPEWFRFVLVVVVVWAAPIVALMSTRVGQQALLDAEILAVEAFGRVVSNSQYQLLERTASWAPYLAAAVAFAGLPLAGVAIAGAVTMISGGRSPRHPRFEQVFAVVAGSGAVIALRALVAAPMDYVRETLTSPTSLGSILSFFEDDTFAARLLGAFDLFMIWWLINLSIGIAVLYKRRTLPIAGALLAVYAGIGISIAIVRTVLAGA